MDEALVTAEKNISAAIVILRRLRNDQVDVCQFAFWKLDKAADHLKEQRMAITQQIQAYFQEGDVL